MHLITWELSIKVPFGHDLSILDGFNDILIVVVDYDDLKLKHGAVINHTALFGDSLRSLDFNVVIL